MANGSTARQRAYAWGILASLTCPCHLPLFAVVLAGTSAGAIVSEHRGIAVLLLSLLFLLALSRALRAWKQRL